MYSLFSTSSHNLSPQSKKYLRCFDTAVFRRPYRCFSIALKVILSLSDRYKLFSNYELKFVKMQFFVKSISLWQQLTKNFEIDRIQILHHLDLLLTIPTPGTYSVVFSKYPSREVKNSVNRTRIKSLLGWFKNIGMVSQKLCRNTLTLREKV